MTITTKEIEYLKPLVEEAEQKVKRIKNKINEYKSILLKHEKGECLLDEAKFELFQVKLKNREKYIYPEALAKYETLQNILNIVKAHEKL